MLQDPVEYIPRAIEAGITSESFYSPARAVIFRRVSEMTSKGEDVELIKLTKEMISDGTMDKVGGPAALSEIYTYAPTGAFFDAHVKGLLDAETLRAIIRFGTEIVTEAHDSESASDMISKVEIGALTLGRQSQDRMSYDYSLKAAYRELMELMQSDDGEGIKTGWANVDAVIGGLHPGEVTVVGARPAVGKTAFAISLAENLAIHNGTPTALFAVEGKRSYLTTRLAAMTAHVSAKRIRDKQLSVGDIQKISGKMKITVDAPLRMDDRISNAVEIAAKIRRMHQQSPLKVVIVDYIQKLPAAIPQERSDLRLRIINATDILHQTCKTLDIALVLLAQLNRSDGKQETDPRVDSLKESGSLEQDADTIILLGNVESQDESTVTEKLVRIAKNRHGPLADLTLNFNNPTTRFY